MKSRIGSFSAVMSAVALALLTAGPAQAQFLSLETWVASNGNDSNGCTRVAPCGSFAGALAKTAANGQITCADSANYGKVSITQSITIDCHDANGFVASNDFSFAIFIDADQFLLSDSHPTVRLRNLTINGSGSRETGILIRGTGGFGGAPPLTVIVEDCLIDGHFGGNARGIDDQRTNSGKLIVTNTPSAITLAEAFRSFRTAPPQGTSRCC